MILLETRRLRFRTHEERDEDEFVQMHTDPEVRRYVGGSPWPVEKVRSRFENEYLGKPTESYGLWAAILKEEDKYVGASGLRRADQKDAAFLAFYFARPYWGRGLASEAAQAFLGVAFGNLRLSRVWADVERGNAASEHILKKFGFQQVRQEVLPGRVLCLYELERDNWLKSRWAEPVRS
jgi:RimJ/RimL family protein N-acetyltransferase